MKTQQIVGMIVAGLLLLGSGFAAGLAWTEYRRDGGRPSAGAVPPPTTLSTESISPTTEVPGSDVPDLPRFPGASRVEYRQVLDSEFRETEVEYVVAGDLTVVHDFYRDVFDEHGWKVADMGVYQGEWTFFVIKDGREALMEIESRGTLIEIEIEIDEPLDSLGGRSTEG